MDRSAFLEALAEVAERLHRRGAVARIYVVGGAAMALAYDAERVSHDIDSVIMDGCGPLIEVVREVARERGWPTTWLNDQAVSYAPTTLDTTARVVFDHPALHVLAASPEHLLAMKAMAGRRTDFDDLVRLIELVGAASASEVLAIVEGVLGGRALPDRGRMVIEAAVQAAQAKALSGEDSPTARDARWGPE